MICSVGAASARPRMQDFTAATCRRVSRKNGNRFSEKIMPEQRDEMMIDSGRSDLIESPDECSKTVHSQPLNSP
jgi:hypothetical protein